MLMAQRISKYLGINCALTVSEPSPTTMDRATSTKNTVRSRYRLLYRLERQLETPMFLLAILWLYFIVKELAVSLSPIEEIVVGIIWILFILEFLLKIWLAKDRVRYIKQNWLTTLGLVVPAFRMFRLLRALRVLRASRVVSTTKYIRALSSTKRFIGDLKKIQGTASVEEMNVGVFIALSPRGNKEDIKTFSERMVEDILEEMEISTGLKWRFHFTDAVHLSSDDPHVPTDFLDNASHRMAEGPFDLMLVVTDVSLVSSNKRTEAGLASKVARIVVLSTKKFLAVTKDQPARHLHSSAVRWNAAGLLLHLIGHVLGLKHGSLAQSKVMAPYSFSEILRGRPSFTETERNSLRKRSAQFPERELWGGNNLEGFVFHLLMGLRHSWEIIKTVINNASLLLSLSLPGLATAAVAPSFLLIFTAEIWDVGLNMSNGRMIVYAVLSIFGASFYLVKAQSLFLPRKEKRVLTEHLAVANSIIFISILNACIGLFIIVGGLMFFIEAYIFPEGLMKTWPTLTSQSEILWTDKLRLAAFIGAIGVTTGALAGGMESGKILRHLQLFNNEP
jgi:predicted Zn-dependent protease